MTRILTFLLLIGPALAAAQEFVATSKLQRVDQDGFYKIELGPEITRYCNSSLSNIRILQSDGVQAPFIIKEGRITFNSSNFIPYRIAEKIILPDSCTVLTLENQSKSLINNINLIIKNAAVWKEGKLFGSDDKINWYALKDKFTLGVIEDVNGTSAMKIIDFPATDYAYFRIWIDDKKTAPLNILNVGYHQSTEEVIKYDAVPVKSFNQSNEIKAGKSYLTILADSARLIEKITWKVSGSPFYQRSASVYTRSSVLDKKGKVRSIDEHIADFELNSRHENVLFLPAMHADNIVIQIENGDNPPLTIHDVMLYQMSRHAIVWLKKGEFYSLNFGVKEMDAPSYDLTFFKENIPESLPAIETEEVLPLIQHAQPASTSFFTTRLFIWAAMIAVITILAFMSFKMIRETKPSNE